MELDTIKKSIQSGRINFLLGSGLSRPYLITLGSIEKWLTDLSLKPYDKKVAVVVRTVCIAYDPVEQIDLCKQRTVNVRELRRWPEHILAILDVEGRKDVLIGFRYDFRHSPPVPTPIREKLEIELHDGEVRNGQPKLPCQAGANPF